MTLVLPSRKKEKTSKGVHLQVKARQVITVILLKYPAKKMKFFTEKSPRASEGKICIKRGVLKLHQSILKDDFKSHLQETKKSAAKERKLKEIMAGGLEKTKLQYGSSVEEKMMNLPLSTLAPITTTIITSATPENFKQHQHHQTVTSITNVANNLINHEQLYNQYKHQQQQQQQQQELPDFDDLFSMCLQEQQPSSVQTKNLTPKQSQQIENRLSKKTFKPNQVRQKKSHAASLSSVSIIRRYETVNIECGSKTQRILIPLDEKTKYRDQWMKQPSDTLTDDQRATLSIALTKSVRTKMKNHARQFCSTNNAVDELQRGSLVYIFITLIERLNPFNPKLVHVSPLAVSNAFVLLTRVVPQSLLEIVFTHLFQLQTSMRRDASPNSKKKIPPLDELITGKESYAIFRLVNDWLMNQLPTKQAAQVLINNGKELPLQTCVRVLNEFRADIVIMLKQLEENQCQLDTITTYKKMVDHVQVRTESITTMLMTQTAKTKLLENVNVISKMGFSLARQQQQQQQQKQQKQSSNLKRKVSHNEEKGTEEKIRKTSRERYKETKCGPIRNKLKSVQKHK